MPGPGPGLGKKLKARAAAQTKKAIKSAERRSTQRAFEKLTTKAVGSPPPKPLSREVKAFRAAKEASRAKRRSANRA